MIFQEKPFSNEGFLFERCLVSYTFFPADNLHLDVEEGSAGPSGRPVVNAGHGGAGGGLSQTVTLKLQSIN